MTTSAQVMPEAAVHGNKVCSHCQSEGPEFECFEHAGKPFCGDCFRERVRVCNHCGEKFLKEDMTEVNDGLYCENCFDQQFRYCSGCEVYIKTDFAFYLERDDKDYCESCFNERVTHCVVCREQINPDGCLRNDDGDPFCDDCWEHREDGNLPCYQEFSGNNFSACRSPRKYGIEIEAVMEEDTDHLEFEKLGSWQQVTDGSLGDNGREYVSPILQGDEGFQEIQKFTGVLQGWGYFVNRDCGLHVHIDGRDLGCEDIKKLLKVTRYFEPVLYAMLPDSRHEGSYSVPLERFPKSRFRIGARDEDALKRLWYGPKGRSVDLKSKYHNSRYYGLNIHSWFYRRSLEFRYHSGTLNFLKITNFIVICQAMVDKAREMKQSRMPQPAAFPELLERFVSFFGLTPDISRYVRDRIQKFHPERLSVPAV